MGFTVTTNGLTLSDLLISSALPLVFLFLSGAGLAWALGGRGAKEPPSTVQSVSSGAINPQVVLDNTSTVMWAEQNDAVLWCNKSYEKLFESRDIQGIRAFSLELEPNADFTSTRARLVHSNLTETAEFSLEKTQVEGVDIYCGSNAERLIESEQELQRFIQILTETFAHLPIGLAIFDKRRDLSLFNPALSGLLDLPAEWLARRPGLMSFLDRLRSEGIMPEPEDFQSIRREFKELESGSINGTYQAEWTLASGRVYRVVGRPHVRGGLALLFEDISKSVMIERQYRAELEQAYSALDSLADGVAIFDPAGELVFVNDAFDEIWDCELAGAVNPVNVIDFSRLLQGKCAPSPAWGDFREFVLDSSERSLWQAEASLNAGGSVHMTFSPICGGQVFCEFKVVERIPEATEGRNKHLA